jgi:hypothetical protein
LRPNSALCVYSDHRGNIGIPCFVPRTGSTAPGCTYPSERVTVSHFSSEKAVSACWTHLHGAVAGRNQRASENASRLGSLSALVLAVSAMPVGMFRLFYKRLSQRCSPRGNQTLCRIDGGRLDPSVAKTEDDASPSAPRKQISVDHYRGYRDRGDPDPNCAPFPNDVPSRCTTGDFHSNNGRVQHLNHGAAPRPRGCAHHASESLYPAWLLPFRLHVGTSLCGRHRHAPAVLQQRTKALPPPPLPRLSFQCVDSRSSPLCFAGGYCCPPPRSTNSIASCWTSPPRTAQIL